MLTNKKHYIIFISNYVLSNPGAGAWTSVIYDASSPETKPLKRYNNYLSETTPNFLSLEAIVETIESINPNIQLTIIHDSSYLSNIITKWIFIWESKNFLTAGGKQMNNAVLIKSLSRQRKNRDINFIYTGNKDKPVYITMANQFSRLFLYDKYPKISPARILDRINNS
jgi:ribonuclease HI